MCFYDMCDTNTENPEEKCIIFFDEMPWLDTHRSNFLSAFEFLGNDFGSAVDNLVFIVCGAATSWLVDNIDHNKGGLFNRQTCKLYLEPFTLHDTKEYLETKGIRWSDYDITEYYMIMGGIPYYLSLLYKEMFKIVSDKSTVTVIFYTTCSLKYFFADPCQIHFLWVFRCSRFCDIIKGEVGFKHVRFGYVTENIIIKDFSLLVRPGQKIAIVGSTGSGKSTLVNILMLFYEISGVCITIDGTPVSEMSRYDLHDIIGMVLQDT